MTLDPAPNPEALRQSADEAVALLKALSNPYRLTILCQLRERPTRVGDLAEMTGLSQSAVSQHLANLRRAGLVRPDRRAQSIYYVFISEAAAAVMDKLADLYCSDAQADTETVSRAA